METQERVLGAVLGLAVGDALGVPVEFQPRERLQQEPVTGMRGHGTHHQPPGTWSDDTSLAMCLLESLLASGFSPEDAGRRFVRWRDTAYWTARGSVFDVGGATNHAIQRIKSGTPAVLAGGKGEGDNGNGSLMRMLPASLYFARSPEVLAARAVSQFSSLTHAHARSRLACLLFSWLVASLLEGRDPAAAVGTALHEARARLASSSPEVASELEHFGLLLRQDLARLPEDKIASGGYVVDTLTAAVWCLLGTGSYRDCVLRAVSLGGDTDTTAAVAGALAGLHYGIAAIPADWTGVLARREEIQDRAGRLHRLGSGPPPFPDSYWVLPGKLLAGEYPGARNPEEATRKLKRLLQAGVSFIVDLTEEGERAGGAPLQPYHGLLDKRCEAVRCPMPDGGVPARDPVRRALGLLDGALAQGKSAYVHCWGGHGRTGVVAGCWLLRHGLADAGSVFKILAQLRKQMPDADKLSPETEGQRRLVQQWGYEG
jgi:ADP-ribosyl-[dinitrogen reductase] hydrolase